IITEKTLAVEDRQFQRYCMSRAEVHLVPELVMFLIPADTENSSAIPRNRLRHVTVAVEVTGHRRRPCRNKDTTVRRIPDCRAGIGAASYLNAYPRYISRPVT